MNKKKTIYKGFNNTRTVVCVQGLGFVGAAMAVACAIAEDEAGNPFYNIIGIDLPTTEGLTKINLINKGQFPIQCEDKKIIDATKKAHSQGNLIATSEITSLAYADVVIVDIPLDLNYDGKDIKIPFDNFKNTIKNIGKNVKNECLIIIETTIPPGTCENIIFPLLKEEFEKRGFKENTVLLAHSFERIMPGKKYLDSIINYWRVYAGFSKEASQACKKFLNKIINTKDYPLTELASTTESELCKILENSYRAVNIAFIEEWSRFSELVGIDLFNIIDAIRKRPTHSNIMQPGFGVGGYCLTKDSLMAEYSNRYIFKLEGIKFPFSNLSIDVNRKMPMTSLKKLHNALGDSLKDKRILILGITYKPNIGDTRNSPSQDFIKEARSLGAIVNWFDPILNYWPEMGEEISYTFEMEPNYDAIVFAVSNDSYKTIDFDTWLGSSDPIILDANNVLSKTQNNYLKTKSQNFIQIGRGR